MPTHKRVVAVGASMGVAGVVIALIGVPLVVLMIGFPLILFGGFVAAAGVVVAVIGGILWLQA